jgi:uncharacterized protein involved in exopolysaccharide biosynthesis
MGKIMNNNQNFILDDEINLVELLTTFWVYKAIIIISFLIGLTSALYIIKTTEKKYTSTVIFKLDQSGSSDFQSTQAGLLASVVGLNQGALGSNLPTDQIKGRIFIETLNKKVNFVSDPFFNTYNPNYKSPKWKTTLKRMIGWDNTPLDANEIVWQRIVSNYSKNVSVTETKENSIKLSVTHNNPNRAAEIANRIMLDLINISKLKKNEAQDGQLNYLSSTLAESLNDLETAQAKLKTFALENSALPIEDFAVESYQLDELRSKLIRTNELHDAVLELSKIIHESDVSNKSYLALRLKFPIVDQVEFRRVLGQNEIISSWSWPSKRTVEAVYSTLSERKKRLETEVNSSKIKAERSFKALEFYSKLKREAAVAEATYTVLIEQVKAQSLFAGYRPEKSEIFDYAFPPISPSSPNKLLLVAVGSIIGIFIGIGLSLLLSNIRGVCNSKNILKKISQAKIVESSRKLKYLRKKSLHAMSVMLQKNTHPILRNIAMEIHKNKLPFIVITSFRSKFKSNDIGQILACYMHSKQTKIAIINFSQSKQNLKKTISNSTIEPFEIFEENENISILAARKDIKILDVLAEKGINTITSKLKKNFELIFLCADNIDTTLLLSSLEEEKAFHISLARIKHTRLNILERTTKLIPIEVLLHD